LRFFVSTLALFLAVAPVVASAVVRDSAPASAPVTFSDGSVAAAFDHCGDADLCGSFTLYEFTRTLNHDAVTSNAFGVHCGNNQATQMTLDHGLVHLTVDEYTDGSLRFIFSPLPAKK
jgi:hypothetical protein